MSGCVTQNDPRTIHQLTWFWLALQLRYDTNMSGIRIPVAAAALLIGACTSGDPTGGVTEGITCSTALTITGGSFAAVMPACPYLMTGSTMCECWPVGMWTFMVSVDTTMAASNTCSSPQLDASYSFTVGTTTDPSSGDLIPTYTMADPNNTYPNNIIKVTDDGTCQGNVSLYSTDGKTVWSFSAAAAAQPTVGTSTTLSGVGLFRQYGSDQWMGSGS